MGVKVPEMKCSFWCEHDIRGTNGTKREKYGEKYSGVNAANETQAFLRNVLFFTAVLIQYICTSNTVCKCYLR